MKTAGKFALVAAAALCVVLTSVCADDRDHASGSPGRKLEFRLAAFNTERIHPDRYPPGAPTGADVFSSAESQRIAESGVAPAGFEWLPISDFLLGQGGGVQPMGITRIVHGQEFLLVTDRPEMMITHAANSPA